MAKDQYENPPGFMSKFFGARPKDQLAKAYGASLTVLDSGAPVMAIARFPHGEVNYVLRGSGVSKEKLIGVLQMSLEERQTLANRGLAYLKKWHDPRKIAQRVVRDYREVLSRKNHGLI